MDTQYLQDRRRQLIEIRAQHVHEQQLHSITDPEYDRDTPVFADETDTIYYHHLTGHIEELKYLIAYMNLNA